MKTTLLWIMTLFLLSTTFAQPVETFPQLLEKIKEHREMIKDVSGTFILFADTPTAGTFQFLNVGDQWLMKSKTVKQNPNQFSKKFVRDISYIQYTASSEFTYYPQTKSAFFQPRKRNTRKTLLPTEDYNPISFVGVDSMGVGKWTIEELYQLTLKSNKEMSITPSITKDGNLLLLTIKFQNITRNIDEDIKVWFDPSRQYSIVRCDEGYISDWHAKQTDIELVATGSPPVYFPKTVFEKTFGHNHSTPHHNGKKNCISMRLHKYEDIKINTGYTSEAIILKLPKGTWVNNTLENKCFTTTADDVDLDQIFAQKNVRVSQ